MMASTTLWWSLFLVVVWNVGAFVARVLDDDEIGFDENYVITWGGDHATYLNQGKGMQLLMDKTSGAGFSSKSIYGSGLFNMRIKLPDINKNTAGVITAFYLFTNDKIHDEVDFEFLGNVIGQPVYLQTNVFANGHGNREQQIYLWFDPSADFHNYRILWNPYQIVFYVDEVPIRVYKNLTSKGIEYPSQPMNIIASLWDGENWVTDHGKIKTNWTFAPFIAQFEGFDVNACAVEASGANHCAAPDLPWNAAEYQTLSPSEVKALQVVQKNYLTYDYCTDPVRYPVPPPECGLQDK